MNDTLTNRRLLIVDDNAAIHEDFRKIFGTAEEETDAFEAAAFKAGAFSLNIDGFDIDSAYQGKEALERVCEEKAKGIPYTVVFMDVRMPPGWDGIETTAKLWAADPDLQVVICTAYSDYSWEEMLVKLGRSDRLVILKKPFDPIEVRQLADCLTKKWQFLQESKNRMAELERLVAERTAEIVREQSRYKAIFENSPVGIFQTSPEGRVLCANPALARMAGFHSPEEMAREITAIGPQLYVDPPRREEFRRLMERDGIVRDFEFEVKRHDGTRGTLSLTAFTVRNEDNAASHFEGFTLDVTDRKKAELERQELEVQLRHAQKMESVGRLAAGIAHEINTPTQYVGDNTRFIKDSCTAFRTAMEALEGLLKAAKDNALTADRIAEVEEILASIDMDYLRSEVPVAIEQSLEGLDRITKIVSAMKEFSHPGSQERSVVDLNRAIETTVLVARNEWKHVAEMKLDLDSSLPAVSCFVGEFN
ncbi:MAG TPA: PAS domain S-box protein [Verrucomicrobiae bacterium]|nr:PAS domain S-box protein [Verrucomicrobiae bacterium]